MKDQDREVIQQVLSAAGNAGVKGWGYAVRWTFIDGVLSIAGNLVLLAATLYLIKRAFAWKIEASWDDDYKGMARGTAICILCVFAAMSFCSAINGVRDSLAPEGAAVMKILTR